MARRRRKASKEAGFARRGGSLTWDVAPLVLLAGAGVALLQEPGRRRRRGESGREVGGGREPGRGRQATSPSQITRRGWKDILLRAKREFTKDNLPMVAAGVTFFTLLALFPGIGSFVALYGLFADVADAQKHLQTLSFVLTPEMLNLIGDQMLRLAAANKGGQSVAFIVSLLLSIWSANGAMKALMTGLTIAYDEEETRGFVKRTAVSLAFTLGFLVFVLLAIALLAAKPAISAFVGPHAGTLFGWLSWPALLVGMTLGLALLYRFGPSRDPVRWRWITWGSVGVVIFWVIASALFSLYVDNFGHFDRTYGSLGAVIGFMMWVYLSVLVVLAGAEINSEIEHQTTVDTTSGPPKPMGLRGARMADTVGAAQG
jgi:membrane protein